ncbi:aspartate:alanine exchanger family transporter [Silvimonas sp. JCM 19000]
MEVIKAFLEQQPLMVMFLTIALGHLAGELNIKGFSLGVGAVLFVALAVGWLVPKAAPAPMIGTLGLALFLYTVGIQYGGQFLLGLTSVAGRRANLLAIIGVVCAALVTLLIQKFTGIKLGYALGLFAGAGTSTASLQATIATLGNDDAAVGYSISYPFGVAGPILLLYIAFLLLKPKIDAAAPTGARALEVTLHNPDLVGKTLAEITAALPSDAQIVALRTGHHNKPAAPELVAQAGDGVLLVVSNANVLQQVSAILGELTPGRLIRDRTDLDYLRVFASRPGIVGRALGDLDVPGGPGVVITQLRRGDTNIMPNPDAVIEFGDRIGMLAQRDQFATLRKYFGDSIKGTAEFSYISIGLGMALGFLLGAIQIPMPVIGKLAVGVCGVLIVALLLGIVRRTRGINWTMPLSANMVLRNLGLTLFLAQVGMSSGPKFAATIADTGLLMLGLGAIVLLALALPVLLLGIFVYKLPYDELAGIVAGACGNPAILAYCNKLTPTDQPDVRYAMIFPAMTIVKILIVDVIGSVL